MRFTSPGPPRRPSPSPSNSAGRSIVISASRGSRRNRHHLLPQARRSAPGPPGGPAASSSPPWRRSPAGAPEQVTAGTSNGSSVTRNAPASRSGAARASPVSKFRRKLKRSLGRRAGGRPLGHHGLHREPRAGYQRDSRGKGQRIRAALPRTPGPPESPRRTRPAAVPGQTGGNGPPEGPHSLPRTTTAPRGPPPCASPGSASTRVTYGVRVVLRTRLPPRAPATQWHTTQRSRPARTSSSTRLQHAPYQLPVVAGHPTLAGDMGERRQALSQQRSRRQSQPSRSIRTAAPAVPPTGPEPPARQPMPA